MQVRFLLLGGGTKAASIEAGETLGDAADRLGLETSGRILKDANSGRTLSWSDEPVDSGTGCFVVTVVPKVDGGR